MLVRKTFADPTWDLLPALYRRINETCDVATTTPTVDVYDETEHFVVSINVPGYAKGNLNLEVHKDAITITGEIPEETTERTYLLHERRVGKFTRRFVLPESVNSEQVTATLKDGVLTITLPKAQAFSAKTIEVTEQ